MSEDVGEVVAIVPKNTREEVRVCLSEFRGVELVDVRVFTDSDKSPERRATPKGVSLKLERLPELIEALQDAAARAVKHGRLKRPAEATDAPRPWYDRD